MSFSSHFRNYFGNFFDSKKRQPLARRPRKARLLVEMLEDRLVMSTLPGAVVGSSALNLESLTPLPGGPAVRPNSVSPTVVIDPLDSTKIVEVHTTFRTDFITPEWVLEGNFSTDAGRTWNFFTVANPITDPATVNPIVPFSQITDPNVAFDRNHHFYVVSSEHNAPGAGPTSGAIVLQRFDFTGTTPVKDLTQGHGTGNTIIYRWYNEDPAANPVLGIDDNNPSFTDPVTGQVQTDTMATMVSIPASATYPYPADLVPKAIYVAYNVNQSFPQPIVPPIQLESRVFMTASADGGHNFTNQELVSDLEHTLGQLNVPQTGTEASNAQIVFSQGTPVTPAVFNYNGQAAPSITLSATTTAAQIQANLVNLPALNGNINVNGAPGGPFTITFMNGVNPGLLTMTGPGSIFKFSNSQDSLTITPPPASGGQMMVFYNDFYNGFNRIYYDVTQPDGGVASTPVASSVQFDSVGAVGISDGIPNPFGNGGPDLPGITNDPMAVDFSAAGDINGINLTSVDDLTVTVSLVHPNLDELSLILVPPPGLPSVTLLLNRIDGAGTVLPSANNPQGLPGAGGSIGSIPLNTNPVSYAPVGTVFDDAAPRIITDGTASAPFIGHFRPEAGSLRALINSPNFMKLAKGPWTLRAIDTKNSGNMPPPTQFIQAWHMNFTGLIATTTLGGANFGGTTGFGTDVPIGLFTPLFTPIKTLPGGPLNVYPTNNPVAPAGTPGIGPVFSVAIDNTLGSFSPFQGRVYVAYTLPGASSIQLITSDHVSGSVLSDSWTIQPALGKVNDDAPGDDFTEGNRTMFNPKITVDPVTGTLGATWYDGRSDAAHVRIANSFTTSIDGGVTFAPDEFLNTQKTATDFYTGATVFLEPTPNNMTVAGVLGFGDSTGLAMYGGRVYPFWSGNLDIAGSVIFTNTVTVAGGPRSRQRRHGPGRQ